MTGGSLNILDIYVEGQIKKILPKKVVDFGAGKGKYGKMLKKLLGGGGVKITAVEIFKPTVTFLKNKKIYDKIEKNNLISWLEKNRKRYDLAIFGDVLEHLNKEEIFYVLYLALKNFRNVIFTVPLKNISQGEIDGYKWEKHKAYIRENDFDGFNIVEKHVVRANQNYYKLNCWIENKKFID